jgi:hypothetical protein
MVESEFERDGYCLLRGVYDKVEIDTLRLQQIARLRADTSEAVRRSESGHVFAARNVLTIWPEATNVWRTPSLVDFLTENLDRDFGLVRGLYFDKPAEHTWTLPLHKDMTIAVKNNRLSSTQFTKPTTKVGVPHVEAPVKVLNRMLTLRIHLDAATPENGTLFVIPGSHHDGKHLKANERIPVPLIAEPGDVLAIRPLVSHCSGKSADGTSMHRRILHLEFAADEQLDDGFEWYQFCRWAG